MTACVHVPKPLRGEFPDISPNQYRENPVSDLVVRWTGFVVDVKNHEKHSCLTVIAKVADEQGKPSRRIRVDQGRFIACKPTYLEAESLLNKPVTITGPVKKLVTQKIDAMDYTYPLVDAKVIFIW